MRKFCYWQNASLLNGISSMCSTACCTLMFIWPSWARCWPEMLFALENGKWMICHDLAKRFYYTVPLQCNAQEFGSPADIAFYFIKLHSSHTHTNAFFMHSWVQHISLINCLGWIFLRVLPCSLSYTTCSRPDFFRYSFACTHSENNAKIKHKGVCWTAPWTLKCHQTSHFLGAF